MRKTFLIFLGSLVGVVATLLLTQPHTLLMGSAAGAAASDTYLKLNLFGDVFERVRAAYVEKPDDSKLVEFGDQRHVGRPRSAFGLHESAQLARHASADAR